MRLCVCVRALCVGVCEHELVGVLYACRCVRACLDCIWHNSFVLYAVDAMPHPPAEIRYVYNQPTSLPDLKFCTPAVTVLAHSAIVRAACAAYHADKLGPVR